MILAQVALVAVFAGLSGLDWARLFLLAPIVPATFVLWLGQTPLLYQGYMNQLVFSHALFSSLAILGVRLSGIRGGWPNPPSSEGKCWQISIKQLLIVTTVVAVVVSGATSLRRLVEGQAETESYVPLYALVDALATSLLTLSIVWALGTSWRWLNFSLMLVLAVFVYTIQVFAFRMEKSWDSHALQFTAWQAFMIASLMVLRLAGWRLIRPHQQLNESRNLDGEYSIE
ncbi:hypothetical protein ETAA8_58510 [Anatilimnocola aggregata]|uniref:Uncharacterized protein n=2 Tax=Anatilimnocola aggregata TaxID=2528021 RepID=A0A517YKF2_9BACT|nr:hypothetical protein ETAA8_58510 [Anatilimnocola aggregata]